MVCSGLPSTYYAREDLLKFIPIVSGPSGMPNSLIPYRDKETHMVVTAYTDHKKDIGGEPAGANNA
jgi:hypothetical protein